MSEQKWWIGVHRIWELLLIRRHCWENKEASLGLGGNMSASHAWWRPCIPKTQSSQNPTIRKASPFFKWEKDSNASEKKTQDGKHTKRRPTSLAFRNTETEPTVRHWHTRTRTAPGKAGHTRRRREGKAGGGGPSDTGAVLQRGSAASETARLLLGKLDILTTWPSFCTPRYLPKKNENLYPHKNL